MKLKNEDIVALKNVLAVCNIGAIDGILIEDGVIRGVNETKTFAIISRMNVPEFGKKIGMTRLNVLKARLDVFVNKEISINAIESSRDEISALEISSGKSKVQFRCTSTAFFNKKVPISLNDTTEFAFNMKPEDSKAVLDAVRVMSAKQVVMQINAAENSISFEIVDDCNEVFRIETHAEIITDSDNKSAVHCYSSDVFCNVLKSTKGEDLPVLIGARGTLKAVVLGHEIALMPQVNRSSE